MQFPEQVKQAIKDIFYDKKVDLYNIEILTDELGGEKSTYVLKKRNIQVNIQPVTQDIVQKQYGNNVTGTYKATCEKDNTFVIPDAGKPLQAINYGGIFYNITGLKFFDNYTEFVVARGNNDRN